MSLDDIINRELVKLGKPKLEGVRYEQYLLRLGNKKVEIFEGSKLINVVSTKKEAIELINTINSGC